MVGFLSQIGWSGDNPAVDTPEPLIQMKKIFVNIDANSANSLTSHFHSKMPHRIDVIDKVIEYLEE